MGHGALETTVSRHDAPVTDMITNRTYDELSVGDSARLVRTLSVGDIRLFAALSGDATPSYVDEEYARSDLFHHIIAHGMWVGALISTVVGTRLPGPGTVWVDETLKFLQPAGVGDTLTVCVRVLEKQARPRVRLACRCVNQRAEVVAEGEAVVQAPAEKINRPRAQLADIELLDKGARLRGLIERVRPAEPLITAVVHPVDNASLTGMHEAAQQGLITPLLVGPDAKIRAAAEVAAVDISPYQVISTEHSHEAAERAVGLVRAGKAQALMKGSLHTDELMHPIIAKESGLRTSRRMTHVFVIDEPSYPRLLLLTDAAINIYPDLETKRDIVQNTIDLAHALGIEMPRVAILAAVETVTPKLQSTWEAAALCKMADRGQITGALLDGPLAFDNAVSPLAARAKHIRSQVAGLADVLVVPDLESGNMLAKQLEYLAGAQIAGVVLGARVPIMLTSRADSALSRLASCAVAVLYRQWQLEQRPQP